MDLQQPEARGENSALLAAGRRTTGLADPVPVIQTLQNRPAGCGDGSAWPARVRRSTCSTRTRRLIAQREAVKTGGGRNRLVLTKSDLERDPASRRDLNALEGRLAASRPGPALRRQRRPDSIREPCLDGALHDPRMPRNPPDVRRWPSNTEAYARPGPGGGHRIRRTSTRTATDAHHWARARARTIQHGHSHEHEHATPRDRHAHEVNHHDAEISVLRCHAGPARCRSSPSATALELLLAQSSAKDLHRGSKASSTSGKFPHARHHPWRLSTSSAIRSGSISLARTGSAHTDRSFNHAHPLPEENAAQLLRGRLGR